MIYTLHGTVASLNIWKRNEIDVRLIKIGEMIISISEL